MEKVVKECKVCENQLIKNNKMIHDVEKRVLQEQLHKENHWSLATYVPKDNPSSRPRRPPPPHSVARSPHPINIVKYHKLVICLCMHEEFHFVLF